MKQYIVKNSDGKIVGKFEKTTEPIIDGDLTITVVDDLDDYDVAEWSEHFVS